MKLTIFTATHPAAFVFLILSLFCSTVIAADPPAQAPPAAVAAVPPAGVDTTTAVAITAPTVEPTNTTPTPVQNTLLTTTPTTPTTPTPALPTTKTTKENTHKVNTTTRKLPPPVTTTAPPPPPTPTTTPPVKTLKSFRLFTPTSIDLATSTSTIDNTIVWLTTTVGEITSVYSVSWVQSFTSMYSVVATPPTGAIGLGTIEGTVGTPRTYKTLTSN